MEARCHYASKATLLVLTPSSSSILSGGRSDDWETWSSVCHVHSCQAQQYTWLCLKYIHVLLQTHNDKITVHKTLKMNYNHLSYLNDVLAPTEIRHLQVNMF
ncbi:Serine/Threonine-Protein Kinase D3 [Manis pentadactyla]|nr:Serine/Threonine-Protein Kinase D3 [Manis pentadactyla]